VFLWVDFLHRALNASATPSDDFWIDLGASDRMTVYLPCFLLIIFVSAREGLE
jgi:hypothetical protein